MKAPTVESVAKRDSTSLNNLIRHLKCFNCLSPDAQGGKAELSTALTELQRAGNLPKTGIYDRATADLLRQPHCQVSSHYALSSHTWDHRNLTYCFDRYSDDLSVIQIRDIITKAFSQWAAYSPLTFTEIAPHLQADIRIRWASGDHGDRYPFDGTGTAEEGNVLAHAFYPPPPIDPNTIAGEIHFDEAENWTTHRLAQVALHEIGHALGLMHSTVSEAIMWPKWTERDMLHADDIAAIHTKYGVRKGRWHCICSQSNADQIIATRNGHLYRRDTDGKVWQHDYFLDWLERDSNSDTVQIDASSYHLDQRHSNGQVWRWTGEWNKIDVGDGNVQIASARDGDNLYQRHENGQVWQYTGGSSWKWLDSNSSTVEITSNSTNVFLRHDDGQIFRYEENPGNWYNICNKSDTTHIVGEGNTLYRLCKSGKIYQLDPYDNWIQIDAYSGNVEIVAGSGNIYLRHSNGDIFWYTGTDMNWVNLSTGRKVLQMAAGGERLYALCDDGVIWQILEGYEDE